MATGDRVGEVVAKKYALGELLGSGGMGDVYRATNTLIGRVVAIKLLRAEHLSNDAILNRFLREARAANLVRHGNVVDVLDMGRDDNGAPYIVQEFLEGSDLKGYLRAHGGHLTSADALMILAPIAEALGIAHKRGVIHRDLKPGNIFMAEVAGKLVPKILDFGVSQIVTSTDERLTVTGETIGTPAYMSPEQIQQPKDVDARTDVWSFGVIVYEVLSGKHPFDTPDSAPGSIFIRIATRDPPPLHEVEPRVGHDLSRIVRRCLRRDRADRYPTALELARDLRLVMAGEEIEPTQKLSKPPPTSLQVAPEIPDLEIPASRQAVSQSSTKAAAVSPPSSQNKVVAAPASDTRDPFANMGVRVLDTDFGDEGDTLEHSPASPVSMPSSGSLRASGNFKALELDDSHRFAPRSHVVARRKAHFDFSPIVGRTLIGLISFGSTVALNKLFHRAAGWRVLSLFSAAFNGLSPFVSGIVALVSLAFCLSAAGVGLLRPPRRIGLVVCALGMMVVAMAMIIVTFAAVSPDAESTAPPEAGRLVPYGLPLAPLGLGLWAMAVAFDQWREEGALRRIASIAIALVAGGALFSAIELAYGAGIVQ